MNRLVGFIAIISMNLSYGQAITVNGVGVTTASTGGGPDVCNNGYKVRNNGIPAPTVGATCITLTDGTAADGEANVWLCDPLDLTNDFNLTFTANFGINNASGDGIVFVLNGNNDAPLGGVGGNIGYATASNNVAVEFDTWPDADIGCHHAEINQDGFSTNLSAPIPLKSCCGSVVDGNNYDICITWEVTAGTTGTLTATFDGNVVASYTGDLAAELGGNSAPNWGLTSGCGAGGGQIQTACNVVMDNQGSTVSSCTTCTSPTVTATPTAETICSGENTNLSISGSVGTTYCWQAADNLNVNGETSSLTNESSANFTISETLTNGVPGTQTVIYTVYPESNSGCFGTPINLTVTVLDPGDPLCNCSAPNLLLDAIFIGEACSPQMLDLFNAVAAASDLAGNTLTYHPTLTDAQNGTNAISNIVSTTGTYYIRLESGSDPGCFSVESVSVTFYLSPTITNASTTDQFCGSGTASFTFTSDIVGTTFTWTGTGSSGNVTGFSPNGSGNVSETLTNNGTAIETVTFTVTPTGPSPTFCDGTPVDFVVTVNPTPAVPIITVTAPTCADPVGVADVTAPTGANFEYSSGVGYQSSTTFSSLAPGNYDITVQDINTGCESTPIAITIDPVPPGPTVTLLAQTDASCNGSSDGSLSIEATGGQAPYTYGWNPNVGTGADLTNIPAGTYFVTVTDDAGCATTESYNVSEPQPITIIGNLVDIDCGSSLGSITTTVTGGSSPYTYNWSPDGESTSGLTDLVPGTYAVTVTDTDGCSGSNSFDIVLTGSLAVDATPSSANLNEGESVDILASGAPTIGTMNWSWSPPDGLSCTDCEDPIASPNETTTYILTGTDELGCTDTATVYIYVEQFCDDFFIPNIFSPNGTGPADNNMFCVAGSCLQDFHLQIFNRWGEMIFESFDQAECWDGTYRNKSVGTGAYVYKFNALKEDGTQLEQSGNLTVVY